MDKEKNKNFFVRLTNFLDLDTRLFGLIFATALIWICFNLVKSVAIHKQLYDTL